MAEMRTEWVRIAPYVKWGLSGGCLGAVIGAGVSAFLDFNVAGGTAAGLGLGALAAVYVIEFKIVGDRTSGTMQDRIAGEQRDPKIVPKMYGDIESGEETAAWHAIALLANYRNPVITRNMLQMVDNRLKDRRMTTLDRLGMVRHAVKCVQGTASQSNLEQLRPFAGDMDSEVGVMVRRLRSDIKDFSLK